MEVMRGGKHFYSLYSLEIMPTIIARFYAAPHNAIFVRIYLCVRQDYFLVHYLFRDQIYIDMSLLFK